jgi:hypothetical protein
MPGRAVLRRICGVVALLVGIAAAADVQVRITGGISGTVVDNTGGVIPGDTVQMKDEDEGTGTQKHKSIVKMGGGIV